MSIPVRAVFSMALKPSKSLLTGHLTFYDKDDKQLHSLVATSGLGGFQTPQHYRTRRKGLCPPYKGLEIVTNGYPLTTIGVEGMFYPIVPDPIPGYGRSEIGLHRDANVPGSSGCIVVRNTPSFNDIVVPLMRLASTSGIKKISLEIDYSIIEDKDLLADEIDIMARTIYGEARGESELGKIAVGWIIKNRVDRGGWWGDDIKEVCLKPYQFSCWNSNDPNRLTIERITLKDKVFQNCLDIAREILDGNLNDPTKGSDHYHARSVLPNWAKGKTPKITIGGHIFYDL